MTVDASASMEAAATCLSDQWYFQKPKNHGSSAPLQRPRRSVETVNWLSDSRSLVAAKPHSTAAGSIVVVSPEAPFVGLKVPSFSL